MSLSTGYPLGITRGWLAEFTCFARWVAIKKVKTFCANRKCFNNFAGWLPWNWLWRWPWHRMRAHFVSSKSILHKLTSQVENTSSQYASGCFIFVANVCFTDGKCVLRAFEKHTFATKIKHPDASHVFLNKHMGALCVSQNTKMCFWCVSKH